MRRGSQDSECNQPLRPTQPPSLSGTRNEYRPEGSHREGNRRSGVTLAMQIPGMSDYRLNNLS